MYQLKNDRCVLLICLLLTISLSAQNLPGFRYNNVLHEQQQLIVNSKDRMRILINAPQTGFGKKDQVMLIFYALPNGNSIEQTMGKRLNPGDDWHYDIQHIAAQTRFLRKFIRNKTIVVVYLEAFQKSWPVWKKENPAYLEDTRKCVEQITAQFAAWKPEVVLNGHSGGGRFIFNYIEAYSAIPSAVKRIAFLDSDYGYEDSIHGPRIREWLKLDRKNTLVALAYNDSVVVYSGKPLVSPTGGTWYRTKMLKNFLNKDFNLYESVVDSLWQYRSTNKQVDIRLFPNPEKKIYHTIQVERNGFIHSILSGTHHDEQKYRYFGKRAYDEWVADTVVIPLRSIRFPVQRKGSETGSAFMKRVEALTGSEREQQIYQALSDGNMPEFLTHTVLLHASFTDSAGIHHTVEYEVLPDYLSIGNDSDFCRIPMTPQTAQKLADEWGASLITAKISDDIYQQAQIKLNPFNYVPVGRENETVQKFVDHQAKIEEQLRQAGGKHGQLIAGIKKDIVLSNRLVTQPTKVVIYGWHKTDGKPIQPVYSGHVNWYVDYSHGIRLVNNQVRVDGRPALLSDILKDPMLYKLFSNENAAMIQTGY